MPPKHRRARLALLTFISAESFAPVGKDAVVPVA
jgi:hypothetical protein